MSTGEKPSSLSSFSVRFVVAVFGGALVGVLLGVLVAAIYDGPQNPFAVMPWTIMAVAVLVLPMSYRSGKDTERGSGAASASEDR